MKTMLRDELRLVVERPNGKTLDPPFEQSIFDREMEVQRQRRDDELRRDVTQKAAVRRVGRAVRRA